MNIGPHTASASLGIHLLWAYKHPDLAQNSIDRLFEEWGNIATYRFTTFASYEVRLVATRIPDNGRACMTDVMKSKEELTAMLEQAVEEFAEAGRNDGRSGSTWIWEQNDKARAEALNRMEMADA